MTRNSDDIVTVSGLSVSRDDVDHYRQHNRRKTSPVPEVVAEVPEQSNKLVLILLFLMVVGLSLVSFYLYQELKVSQTELAENYRRIDQLEKRLSFTDESMNQSGASLQGRLQQMDIEVRKLWDNVWKKSKDRMDNMESSLAKADAQQKKLAQILEKIQKESAGDKDTLSSLEKRAAELDKTALMAKSAQASMQTVLKSTEKQSIKLTDLEEDVDSLKSRLQSNEDWIRSVNEFRKQVNRDLEALRQQGGAPPPQ